MLSNTMNAQQANYSLHQGKRNSPKILPHFAESLENLFSTIKHAVPEGNLTIESLALRGDKAVVKYRVQGVDNDRASLSTKKPVTVNSLDIISLNNGKVVEHWDTVYQVNT